MSKKVKKVKPTGLFHVQVDVGNLPPHRVQSYLNDIRDALKKPFKKHGTTIVSGYSGGCRGQVEIIRVI